MDPFINLEEQLGKVVGRRTIHDSFDYGMKLQKAGSTHKKFTGLPKGVFRFHSHEEADEWMMTKLAEAAAKKKD